MTPCSVRNASVTDLRSPSRNVRSEAGLSGAAARARLTGQQRSRSPLPGDAGCVPTLRNQQELVRDGVGTCVRTGHTGLLAATLPRREKVFWNRSGSAASVAQVTGGRRSPPREGTV